MSRKKKASRWEDLSWWKSSSAASQDAAERRRFSFHHNDENDDDLDDEEDDLNDYSCKKYIYKMYVYSAALRGRKKEVFF